MTTQGLEGVRGLPLGFRVVDASVSGLGLQFGCLGFKIVGI